MARCPAKLIADSRRGVDAQPQTTPIGAVCGALSLLSPGRAVYVIRAPENSKATIEPAMRILDLCVPGRHRLESSLKPRGGSTVAG